MERGPFFQQLAGGDYAQIVLSAIDQASQPLDARDIPWVVGALSFVGRSIEAEGLLQGWSQKMNRDQNIAARFFLAVSKSREGQHDAARKLFLQNFRESRIASSESRFFAQQGLAFYRYSQGRLPAARLWAEAAVRDATAALFPYGLVLSLELLGHVQLSAGQIHAGFRTLGLARKRAESLGQGALLQAMDVTLGLYRSTFALEGSADGTVQALEQLLEAVTFEDSYTRASLILELARTRLLQGRWALSKSLLESASVLVYQIDNPDLEMNYNLQLANLLRQQGESHQALSLVRSARHRAQSQPDMRSLVRALGFEAELLGELGRTGDQAALMPEIETLTRRCGSLIATRNLARSQRRKMESIRPGDDPLGDLIDQAVHFAVTALPSIIQSGWLSLLAIALDIKHHERVLYFDAEAGSLTLFDRGEVEHKAEGCSDFIRKLILVLAQGECSKEMLALHLWGKSYSPLRHDRLIYALVAKARRLLGSAGDWIEACEVGYRLRPGIRVAARDLQSALTTERTLKKAPESKSLENRFLANLNTRQATILEWMRSGEVIEPRSIGERLKVSDATVTRDLGGLIDLGLAHRVGKGRATRYAIMNKQSN